MADLLSDTLAFFTGLNHAHVTVNVVHVFSGSEISIIKYSNSLHLRTVGQMMKSWNG
jgi:hypothetical protein